MVATEDQRFYAHPGSILIGIARALFTDVVLRRPSQGGSTISQQYVKNAFGSPTRRCAQGRRSAARQQVIEQSYTKDQISSST